MGFLREISDYFNGLILRMFAAARSEKGQTLVEYALLLVLIAVVVYIMVKGVGQKTCSVYSAVNCALNNP